MTDERTGASRREPEARERRRPPERPGSDREDPHGEAPRRRRRPDASEAAERALRQIRTLTNRGVEGVVGVEPVEDGGYLVTVEVLEIERVPNTSDVLAEYEVGVDENGRLLSYRRRDRYTRGSTRSE